MNTPRVYSFSRYQQYLTCSWAYKLKYVEGLKTNYISSNLVYGNCIHKVTEQSFLNPDLSAADAADIFLSDFRQQLTKQSIRYSSTMTESDLIKMGLKHSELIPNAVANSRLHPVKVNGKPAIEVPFTVNITDEIQYRGYIDLIALHLDRCEVGVIDHKTSQQATNAFLASVSNQLVGYSITETLPGFPSIEFVGFWDFQKRKVTPKGKGPEVLSLKTANAPSLDQRKNFADLLIWVDKQVHEGAFFKDPRSNYNTPCTMCDYREYCHNGDRTFLIS